MEKGIDGRASSISSSMHDQERHSFHHTISSHYLLPFFFRSFFTPEEDNEGMRL